MERRSGRELAGIIRGRRALSRGRRAAGNQLAGADKYRQLVLGVFKLDLPAAGVVAEVLVDHAIRQVFGTRCFGLHAGMPVVVTVHLGRRTVRTRVIVRVPVGGFHRHGAGRQREVQPDSDEQPEGALAPGSLLPAVSRMTQLVDSNTVSAIRLVSPGLEVKDWRHAPQKMNWKENWFEPTADSQSLLSSQT